MTQVVCSLPGLILSVLSFMLSAHGEASWPMPPDFLSLGPPPKPPGVFLELYCDAYDKVFLPTSDGSVGGASMFPIPPPGRTNHRPPSRGKDVDFVEKPAHVVDSYNISHDVKPPSFDQDFPEESATKTPSISTSSEGKKKWTVGMIMGMVIGLLLLLLLALLAYIFGRRRYIKYQIEPESEAERQGNFLDNYKIRGWFWRRSQRGKASHSGEKGRKKLFKGVHVKDRMHDGTLSSTSSESGYCEEALDNQENTAAEKDSSKPVMRRNRSPRPRGHSSSTKALTMKDDTPDIIASTQGYEDAEPKRWSIFGLLPSLKPLRCVGEPEISTGASPTLGAEFQPTQTPPDSPGYVVPTPKSGHRKKRKGNQEKSMSDIPMESLSGDPTVQENPEDGKTRGMLDPLPPVPSSDAEIPEDEQQTKVHRKRSRVRIKSGSKKNPEVNL